MRRLAIGALSLVMVSVMAPVSQAGVSYPAPTSYLLRSTGPIHVTIPDNTAGGVTHDIVVSEAGLILDLVVRLYISHTWVGDLMVTLTHVDTGTVIALIDRPGVPASSFGCSGDDIDVVLNDAAAAPVEDQCAGAVPTISGIFTPNQPLFSFDGEDMAGTWRLTVSDHSGGDTGFLAFWALSFGVRTCDGVPATIVGTPGDDHLVGTSGNDVIVGLAGDDHIEGLGGDDVICGGAGKDLLDGGLGQDRLFGQKGSDVLIGGPGHDLIVGGPGRDWVDYSGAPSAVVVDLGAGTASGGAGVDTIVGVENIIGSFFDDALIGSGKPNVIRGGFGDDTIVGKKKADRLFGEGGDDKIYGGKGNDELSGGPGIDTLDGGPGTDTCRSGEFKTACEL